MSESNEKEHYQKLRQINQRNLEILEEQIAQYGGRKYAPPHVLAEHEELRKALSIIDTVLAFPLTISDDLDERGRFAAYIGGLKELRQFFGEGIARVEQSIVAVEGRMTRRHDQADRKSRIWRIGGTIAFFILIVVVLSVAGVVIFWAGRMSGSGAFVRDVVGLWVR